MAVLLKGNGVVAEMNSNLQKKANKLRASGIVPTLAIVRVGEEKSQITYESSAAKRCEAIGIQVERYHLDETVSQEQLLDTIAEINEEKQIHGCLLLRPLPPHMDDQKVRQTIDYQKDCDGITDVSLAGVVTRTDQGYPPCTAQACMEILNHYQIPVSGKKVVVIGKSLVVGMPLAMMLMNQDATVSVCHIKTHPEDMVWLCREADILISAAGCAHLITAEHVKKGQTIIDVGINITDGGTICGDVDYDEVADIVAAITPVPGGVGSVTTSVLAKNVIHSAESGSGK